MLKNLYTLIALCLCTFALPACNTVDGMGKDMESLGNNIEDAAD